LQFIGGTALRIGYSLPRFSEDLDFDTNGFNFEGFKNLSRKVQSGLESEGLACEISFSGKSAFRCKIRLPKLLYQQGLSMYEDEKILIQ